MEKIPTDIELINHGESGWLEGRKYNVGYLYVWAKQRFPIEDIDTLDLRDQILDITFEPKALEKIDSDKPILLSNNNQVVDGKHRLYKAIVIDKRNTIKFIRLPNELPPEAVI